MRDLVRRLGSWHRSERERAIADLGGLSCGDWQELRTHLRLPTHPARGASDRALLVVPPVLGAAVLMLSWWYEVAPWEFAAAPAIITLLVVSGAAAAVWRELRLAVVGASIAAAGTPQSLIALLECVRLRRSREDLTGPIASAIAWALPRVDAEVFAALDEQQVQKLWALVERLRDERIILEVIRLFDRHGGPADLAAMEATCDAWLWPPVNEQRVQAAARRAVSAVQKRIERLHGGELLVRPADAPLEQGATLLRPAPAGAHGDDDQLLRPAEPAVPEATGDRPPALPEEHSLEAPNPVTGR